jgi:hypothetical protein
LYQLNEGLQNTSLPKPDQVWLLSQFRRATVGDQKAVLNWLLAKFKLEVAAKLSSTEGDDLE